MELPEAPIITFHRGLFSNIKSFFLHVLYYEWVWDALAFPDRLDIQILGNDEVLLPSLERLTVHIGGVCLVARNRRKHGFPLKELKAIGHGTEKDDMDILRGLVGKAHFPWQAA